VLAADIGSESGPNCSEEQDRPRSLVIQSATWHGYINPALLIAGAGHATYLPEYSNADVRYKRTFVWPNPNMIFRGQLPLHTAVSSNYSENIFLHVYCQFVATCSNLDSYPCENVFKLT